MDNMQFGAFIAQLRKELGLTQKELADKLNVTDKAVSKWETGKGFPDVKLLEPLAQALGVSLVELIQCRRQETDSLTVAEAEQVVTQALDQSERTTARRYLRLLRWMLTGTSLLCMSTFIPYLKRFLSDLYFDLILRPQYDIIGGADGPTTIFVGTATINEPPVWLRLGLPAVLAVVCLLLVFRVRNLEKKLK